MKPTKYVDINNLLEELLYEIKLVLKDNLKGLYVYGSLALDDFDRDLSDIDLFVITADEINALEFEKLERMHDTFVSKYSKWNNRIEIAYVSLKGLKAFKNNPCLIAIVSPGEPFHIKEAGNDWLINLYNMSKHSVTLYGQDIKIVIEPISDDEFLEAVKKQVKEWKDYVVTTKSSRSSQGYAILTLCRALYVCFNRKQASKKEAAQWAIKELPEYADQIKKALQWRVDYRAKTIDAEETYAETVKFVRFVAEAIEKGQNHLVFRPLMQTDIPFIVAAFAEMGWNKPASLYKQYLKEQTSGKRCVWVAWMDHSFAGYVTLKWHSDYQQFANQHIPEINDLNVVTKFRRQGVGSQLLALAEAEAAKQAKIVGLGVGLYADYGQAQKLYIKRGYAPDGLGVTYKNKQVKPDQLVQVDDDLILWLVKGLQ